MHIGARAGKQDQIGQIYVISGMLKLFGHYVSAQAEYSTRLHGPVMEKALDPVLVIGEQKVLNLWSIHILNISAEQVSQ